MARPANPNRPEYARLIAEARKQHGLTQEMLGKKIKRSAAVVKKYEAGKVVPTYKVQKRLIKVLELDKSTIHFTRATMEF